MCRMIAYTGAPISLDRVFWSGEHSLERQSYAPRELLSGSVNVDGWGVTWYSENSAHRLAGVAPLWHEPDLRDALAQLRSNRILAAVRNVTPGIPVDPSGTPPLRHGRFTFALNGFIEDFRRRDMRALRGSLPDGLYGALRGSSDTETLFLSAIHRIRSGRSPEQALRDLCREVVVRVRNDGREAQLNLLLGTSDAVYAVRTSSVDRSNSLYFSDGGALGPDGVWIASEPLDSDDRWSAVSHDEMIVVADGGIRRERALSSSE